MLHSLNAEGRRSLGTLKTTSRPSLPGGILEHNKQLIYNIDSPTSPRVKDAQWVRSLRKSPYVLHGENWKSDDEALKAKIVSAGNVKVFLHDGAEVTGGKALVSVTYHYCTSCKRDPIEVSGLSRS